MPRVSGHNGGIMHLTSEVTTEQKTSARQEAGAAVTLDDVPLTAPGNSSSSIGSSSSSSGTPAWQKADPNGQAGL